jgi:hypothetical protein
MPVGQIVEVTIRAVIPIADGIKYKSIGDTISQR